MENKASVNIVPENVPVIVADDKERVVVELKNGSIYIRRFE